jgi:hypothetical protein
MVLVSSDSNVNLAIECRMFECISISLCWVVNLLGALPDVWFDR